MNWIIYLHFKHPHMVQEFHNAPMILQHVALTFVELSITLFGIEPTVTRILDKVAGDSGVHYQLRAIDFRDEYMHDFTYTKAQADTLVFAINERYKRIDEFDTIKHHSFNGDPTHFHIQVPHESINMRGPLYKPQ